MGNNEEFSKIPNLEEGLAAFEARDYTKAFELLKPIAEQGDAEAQCIVASMYQLELGIERSDSSGLEAIKVMV
jgi:TPR repeat protein